VQLEFSDDGPGAQDPTVCSIPSTVQSHGQGPDWIECVLRIIQEHKGKSCVTDPKAGPFRIELPAVVKEATWAEAPSEAGDAEVQSQRNLTLPPTP